MIRLTYSYPCACDQAGPDLHVHTMETRHADDADAARVSAEVIEKLRAAGVIVEQVTIEKFVSAAAGGSGDRS